MFRLSPVLVLGFILAAAPAFAAPALKLAKGKSTASSFIPIDAKIRGQMLNIQRALMSGKITQAQAKTLKAELQAIQKKKAEFVKQNGKNVLSADQESQLNQMLLNNGKNLPDDPLERKTKSRPPDPLEKNLTKMPVDPLERNAKKLPVDPLDAKAANLK